MRTAALIIVALIIAFFLYQAFSNQSIEEEVAQAQKPIHPETIAAYQNNCASCHGVNLQGQEDWQNTLDEDGHRLAPPLNGTGHTWHHSPDYLFQVIKYGFPSFDPNYEGKMLGNDSLSEEEVWQLITYIRQEWPAQIQDVYNSRYE
tara:strand:+ start:105 stop:545 length:441 start_codon:yes stop_codon:yes gene_type:complete